MKISLLIPTLLFSFNALALTNETRIVRSYLHVKDTDAYNFQAETQNGSEELMPVSRDAAIELEKLQYGKRYECKIESMKFSGLEVGEETRLLVYGAFGCKEL